MQVLKLGFVLFSLLGFVANSAEVEIETSRGKIFF